MTRLPFWLEEAGVFSSLGGQDFKMRLADFIPVNNTETV